MLRTPSVSIERVVLRCRRLVRAAVLGALLFGARAASAQFTIENLEMHFPADLREPMTQLIPLRSEIDSVQQVRLWLSDWERDSVGGNRMLPYGEGPGSCGSRLSIFPSTLQLGPRAVEYVRVTYTPAAADSGCWSIVLSETLRPPRPSSNERGASVSINTITGVKVYVPAANAVARGDIISADVEAFYLPMDPPSRDSTLERQVAVRFENTGTAHLRVKSEVEIRDVSGVIVQRLTGPEAYITPAAFRDILVRLPRTLRSGRYAAVVLLDFGADEIMAAQVEFEIP